eukprot:CCRYP_004065-RA/>CCRYP_004065-RA protein AED:0.01 eAED:0.01 QI:320/1/1/1/1/1/2/315/569
MTGWEASVYNISGVVESVSMNLKTMQILYHVMKDGHKIGTEPISENELAYAFQCPVSIFPREDETNEPIDGVVLQARKSNTGVDDGGVVYTVMHDADGGYKAYTEGIEASRIKYRRVVKDDVTSATKESPSSRAIDSQEEKVNAPQNASSNLKALSDDHEEQPLSAITFDSDPTSRENSQTSSSGEKSHDVVALPRSLQSGQNNVPTATLASGECASARSTGVIEDPHLNTGISTRGYSISRDWSLDNGHESVSSSSNKLDSYEQLATCDTISNNRHRRERGNDRAISLGTTCGASANKLHNEQKNESAVCGREDRETDALNRPSKKPRSNGEAVEIPVPQWLHKDKDSRERLYSHLIGPENDPHTLRIQKDTKCDFHVLWKESSEKPMTIQIKHSQLSGVLAQRNLIAARRRIEDLLLKFKLPNLPSIEEDGSKGRLLYEVANSYKGAHTPKGTKCGAVYQRNPLSVAQKHCCMSLLELPYTTGVKGKVFHGHFFANQHIGSKVKRETGCSIVVFGDEFDIPVKYCDPYVLISGPSGNWMDLDRAVELVKEEIRRHQRHCDCSFLNQT